MKEFRRLIDLTDDEIKFIINELLEPISISDIIRDATWDQIDCTIVTGGWQSEDCAFEIEDGITLTYEEIEVPFEFTEEEKNKYQQYLFAKGCNALYTELQNNNPYLSKN